MDREKVIKGLERHRVDNNHRIKCADCPYYVDDGNHIRCVNDLHDDAIALLKEQNTVEHALDILRGHGWKETDDVPYANEQEQHPVIVCPHCGKRVK